MLSAMMVGAIAEGWVLLDLKKSLLMPGRVLQPSFVYRQGVFSHFCHSLVSASDFDMSSVPPIIVVIDT
jgi:hypothetical protein